MRVELLCFDGCPSAEALLPRLRTLVAEAGGDPAAIVVRQVTTAEAAEAERFLGSPTVRVDDEDVEPGAEDRQDVGLSCRVYRSAQGATGVPPDAWIRQALDRARRAR